MATAASFATSVTSITPILIEQDASLINYDSNAKHFRSMSRFSLDDDSAHIDDTMDYIDIDFDNLHQSDLENIDTMHSILLTPQSSMKYVKFEKDNHHFIQMGLLKYPGDYHHSIRYFARPHLKYILYIPSIRMFFYSDGNNNIEKHTLINVKSIITSDTEKECHKQGVTNKYIKQKYKDKWIKIVGVHRIALFVSNEIKNIQALSKYIQNSLYINKELSQKDYIQGILSKFIGKNMSEMKLNKSHSKHVIYITTAKILIYGDNDKDRQKCNILYVQGIDKNPHSRNKSLNAKYRNKWFRIQGTTRDVLFSASSPQDATKWYEIIKHSL